MNTGNRPPQNGRQRRRAGWVLGAVVVVASAGVARAQAPADAPVAPLRFDAVAAMSAAPAGGVVPAVGAGLPGAGAGVVPASGCASCGSAGSLPPGPGVWGYGKHGLPGYGPEGCGAGGCGGEGCGEAGCVPGRPPCETCEGHSRMGRLFCAFHNALCCPDPCYEPRWSCGPNAALFVDYARTATVSRFRWDSGVNVIQPDRAEYFWANSRGKGPKRPETGVDYNELHYYQEIATDKFSFFIDTPYRNVQPQQNPGAGGFGDLMVGTKSMLLDSELVQTTFQLAVSIPTGVPGRGIGTGHVSIDPSLLWGVKLYTDTYWQSQLGYWIPISGSSVSGPGIDGVAVNGANATGGVLHYQNSLNHVLCRPMRDVSVVGSIESVGYTFTAGKYTDPATGLIAPANDTTYFAVGPGFRVCVCDRIDTGFGMLFSVTDPRFADQLYRTEIRIRY